MAYEGSQICIPGLTASADLSAAANQYKYVEMSADKQVNVTNANTDKAVGVLQNRPASGEAAVVCAIGITKLQGDADLAFGDSIGPSADGQAAAYTASDTTKHINGTVIEGNGAAGGYITAIVVCGGTRTLA